jgi:polyisoprenyl-teichoic acid--peptidoglycan teichoic acid transferase
VIARHGRSSALAALLSLLWPGLGQAYRGERSRAVLFATPPLLLIVAFGSLALLINPAVLATHLLIPAYALTAALMTLAVAIWWAAAIIDAGRPESGPLDGLVRARRRPTAIVAVLVGLLGVALVAGWTGTLVLSFYEAGQQISRPITEPTPQPTPGSTPAPGTTPDSTPTPTPTTRPPNLAGRVTVLFLGADLGTGEEGELTDTIQVASYDPRSDEIAVISVPRDTGQLTLYNGGTWEGKINALMSYAEAHPRRFPDGGLGTLERQLEYIIGIPIDYHAAVDFSGFRQLVDMVGGITVTVERPINDPRIWHRGSPGFSIEPGEHHLDGETALVYARSRHGPGNSDFQRARRQQQVLLALRHRIDDPRVLTNLPSIVEAASAMVRTNAPLDHLPRIVELLQRSTAAQDQSYVLRPPRYAEVVPRSEVGNVYMIRLHMDRVAELSIELFGEDSRYSHGAAP